MRRTLAFASLAWLVTGARVAAADEPAPPPQAAVVIAPSPAAAAKADAKGVSVATKPNGTAPVAAKPPTAPTAPAAKGKPTTAPAKPKHTAKHDELPKGMHWHTVKKDQKLGSIAKRYHVTLEALLAANDIARRNKVQPGLKLLVPAPDDADGERAREVRIKLMGERDALGTHGKKGDASKDREPERDARKSKEEPQKDASWLPFVEKPKKKGVVSLKGMKAEFTGRLIARSGKLAPKARREVEHVLSADEGVTIDADLLKLIARVSDTFGGRTLNVVSGYRTAGTAEQSKHKQGKALDFTVEGVPNEALRDYCKSLDGVGVGYYPNAGFIHLDVRERWTTWVDESGRGEPPRYTETTAKPAASADGPELRVR